MKLPTASQLDRVLNCPASHVLPQVRTQSDAADFGTAVHRFLQRAHEVGRDEALAEMSDGSARDLCEQLPLDELPSGGAREVSVAYSLTTGKARVLGKERDYSDVADNEMCGTVDLWGTRGRIGIVKDWKSGRYVGKPENAAQLLFFALVLTLLFDLDAVEVSFVYLRDDGTYYEDKATVDHFDLAAFAEQLRALPGRIVFERLKIESGQQPDVSNGPWCRFCPAAPACPAKVALAKSFGGELVSIRDRVAALAPDEAGKVYARALEYKDIVEEVIAGLKEVARVTPLELPDGRVLQETMIKLPTKVDAAVAEQVLAETYGDDVAREAVAVEKSTTLTAIESALRKRAAPGKLAKMKRETVEAIRARGGLREGNAVQVRACKR